MKKLLIFSIIFISLIVIILTITPWVFSHNEKIFNSINSIPKFDKIILLGARVYPKGVLSPILKQRSDTAIIIYKKYGKKILISGSGNYEVKNIKKYLLKNGVKEKDLEFDFLGYDTHDSVRHVEKLGIKTPLFITQSFHLFRVLEMGVDHKLTPYGVASEKIFPTKDNISFFKKYGIKILRHYRNSTLFWLYKTGLYDKFSDEAERIEKKRGI